MEEEDDHVASSPNSQAEVKPVFARKEEPQKVQAPIFDLDSMLG